MNERRFRKNVILTLVVYAAAIAALILVRVNFPDEKSIEYNTLRELIPLIIAIPAAWLAYSFQRRQSYLKDVRDLYSHMVSATQDAIQYTHLEKPNSSDFGRVQKSLSSATEEIRAVFLNLGQTEERVGLYPFEGIKTIGAALEELGFGDQLTPEARRTARSKIVDEWKELRKHFLSECDRGIPVNPHSPFLD